MATTHSKSATITNLELLNPSSLNITKLGGQVKQVAETYEVTADSATSTTRFFRVHSGWRVGSIKLYSDDTGAAGVVHVGLYDTTENGGAVVDADFWAASVDVKTAALFGYEVNRCQAFGPEDLGKELWAQLDLTADPNKWYDVALTIATALSGVSTLTLIANYVDGN